ncbi:MAG TPA: DUF58 domain-containing protein [Planctomycetaceae bacterium]|nr:DUF58 domain-containing protein [Planctomycetaceae bacterium]
MLRFFRTIPERTPKTDVAGTASAAELVDPRVMERIGHLELLSRTVVDGLLAGKHRSTTKGGCCEFAQHRQYAPGDEIRQIDWQVYARNDRYFIKQFEEETNLHGIVALDTSGSMKFGLSTISKLDYARRAAACLARLLLHQRDAVGAVILNEKRPLFVPPKQNAAHLQAILSCLQAAEPGAGGSLGAQIRSIIPRLRRRGLFVLFSDCFGDLDDLSQALRAVRGRGHDVVVMNVLAPEEIHFDFRRWSSFRSLEVAGHQVNLDPAALRDEYLKQIRRHLEQLEEIITGLGGDYVRMTTNHPLADVLGWFLRGRMARGT